MCRLGERLFWVTGAAEGAEIGEGKRALNLRQHRLFYLDRKLDSPLTERPGRFPKALVRQFGFYKAIFQPGERSPQRRA